jgi:hypothetical protein
VRRHPSFLLKIKITILHIPLSVSLPPSFSLSLSLSFRPSLSIYLSPSLSVFLHLSLSLYLSLTGEEGVRTLFTGREREIKREGGRGRERERERERKREGESVSKRERAFHIQSVSQSVGMRDYYINSTDHRFRCKYLMSITTIDSHCFKL